MFQVRLTVITGWTLGQGPCGPNCTYRNIGDATDVQRNSQTNSNKFYFGRWTTEVRLLVAKLPVMVAIWGGVASCSMQLQARFGEHLSKTGLVKAHMTECEGRFTREDGAFWVRLREARSIS